MKAITQLRAQVYAILLQNMTFTLFGENETTGIFLWFAPLHDFFYARLWIGYVIL